MTVCIVKGVSINKYLGNPSSCNRYDTNNLTYDDLGYEDTTHPGKESHDDISSSYGNDDFIAAYENALYGYEEAKPAVRRSSATQKAPRRSSLKGRGAPRRASIGYTGEVELRLPNNDRRVKKKTSLTFKTDDDVEEVEPMSRLTEQPESLWFQKTEYEHIKKKIYSILRKKSTSDDDTRGLEAVIDSEATVAERYDAYVSVLDEQRQQRARGMYSDTQLSNMYHFHTIDSTIRARERAEQDATEIENYVSSTRRMMRRISC